MLILLKTSGFLVSATNGLNLLNKKFIFSVLLLVLSLHVDNTAYRGILEESPEEIRKAKYTNRATMFSLQKYFKCQQSNNHWTLTKCRSRLTSIASSSNSPCPSFSSPWPLSSAPPSSFFSSMNPTIQKYCKRSIELNIRK